MNPSSCRHQDEEWRKAVEQLARDLETKVDRLEWDALRDELQKQLRALTKRLNALKASGAIEDEAAGIRKQLIQRFHCISCDKPVDMMPQK